MAIGAYLDSIRRGLRRPEVRRHPVRAVTRRLSWRWHWKRFPDTPIVLRDWWRGLSIALPNTGNASLLYYRTHSDESLLWILQALLAPRMTFLDVGAHIGAFTLIGAHLVGKEGRVCALEPMPPCVEAIRRNAAMNALANVTVYQGALASCSGKIGFVSDAGQTGGWIAGGGRSVAFEAPCWTLDDFLPFAGLTKVDVLKLDTSGNELAALRGGATALRNGKIGALVMKLYHPNVTRERFGYDSRDSVRLLAEWGLKLKLCCRQETFPLFRPEDADEHFDRLVYSHVLVASA